MQNEIIDIIWDFAHSVAKTTLNPHITADASRSQNKKLAIDTAKEIMAVMKQHESTKQPTKNKATVG